VLNKFYVFHEKPYSSRPDSLNYRNFSLDYDVTTPIMMLYCARVFIILTFYRTIWL